MPGITIASNGRRAFTESPSASQSQTRRRRCARARMGLTSSALSDPGARSARERWRLRATHGVAGADTTATDGRLGRAARSRTRSSRTLPAEGQPSPLHEVHVRPGRLSACRVPTRRVRFWPRRAARQILSGQPKADQCDGRESGDADADSETPKSIDPHWPAARHLQAGGSMSRAMAHRHGWPMRTIWMLISKPTLAMPSKSAERRNP
jgi:hypothetical protein